MSILITKQGGEQVLLESSTRLQLTLDKHGVCSFEHTLGNTVDSTVDIVDIKEQFQLLTSSRYSFFGCWLHMQPLSNISSTAPLFFVINKKRKKKLLFIYRDSLSAVDFSRLSQVIRNLKMPS